MRRLLIAFVITGLAATVGTGAASFGAPPPQAAPQAASHAPVCPGPAQPDSARCNSQVVTDANGRPLASATYQSGLRPSDLQDAYKVSTAATRTVAIVDAYNDPNAVADVSVYRNQFGLGGCTGTVTVGGCTFSNGATIKKVNQNGATTSYPRNNGGWAQEISLDVDMVSAMCPTCNILLVEASSNSFNNLAAAVDTAANQGANAISNSYGGGEFSGEVTSQSHYNHPGVAVTASSGDGGYGVEFPAASQYVTAVGGTTLTKDTSTRGWSETVWSGAGSGCSAYVPKPGYQKDTGCNKRTVADVSAVANPNNGSGVAVYDSYSSQGISGWMVFGGTSVASPIIATIYAAAGIGSTVNDASVPYGHTSSLNDVTSGSNGSCGSSYLCTAKAGYDGPTGLGTPNGTTAF